MNTYVRYHGIIEDYIAKATIADLPLQKLGPSQLEAYYATVKGSASTRTSHHTVIHGALKKAKRDKLVSVNVAHDLEGKPTRPRGRSEDARIN